MSLLEIRTEDWACSEAEKLGWFALKLNNRFSNGWPDRMFIKEDSVFFIEFKREGKDARKLQKYRGRKLTKLGHRVYLVDNKEEVLNVFRYEAAGAVGSPPISRMGR